MRLGKKVWVWIGVATITLFVTASCCRGRGTKCLYDRPCGGGVVGIRWTPVEHWSYGLTIEARGSHVSTTKALAVNDPSEGDDFIVFGDGTLHAYKPAHFYAPVRVKEIYTDSGAKWPDYVFEPSYKLRNLSELEAFIRQNKHLPGLPSQAEISHQGIPLVSTQKAIVEKVEELTLYVIALQKQVDSLKALLRNQSPPPSHEPLR
jgi:hypothetical protein